MAAREDRNKDFFDHPLLTDNDLGQLILKQLSRLAEKPRGFDVGIVLSGAWRCCGIEGHRSPSQSTSSGCEPISAISKAGHGPANPCQSILADSPTTRVDRPKSSFHRAQ